MRAALLALAALALLYVGAVGFLYLVQRSLVFLPIGVAGEPDPRRLPGVEAVTIAMADGTPLTVWARAPEAGRPTILYFHGNAGTLSIRTPRFAEIAASGFGLLAPAYRGYSGSGGTPSEEALIRDALALFDRLRACVEGPIVLHGESLGTSVATAVAAEREAAALILEAPFTAALDLAAAQYPWVPVGLLMRDPFLTRERLPRVSAPVLIVHGTEDGIVPVEHGRRLAALHPGAEMIAVEGGRHSDLWERGLWDAALAFLEKRGIAARASGAPLAPQAAEVLAFCVRAMPSRAGL